MLLFRGKCLWKTSYEYTFFCSSTFRGFVTSSREFSTSLWQEFFRDPLRFYDFRYIKKSHKSPDFLHKHTRIALWIDEFFNPPWVHEKLQKIELPPLEHKNDRDTIIQLIKSCGRTRDISTLEKTHADNGWLTSDISIANTLIRSYGKCCAVKEAQIVFDQLPQRDVISWNALISGYVDEGLGEEAITCFRKMESDVVIRNPVTYLCSLKACALVRDLTLVKEIHAQVKARGILQNDIALGTALVNGYAKCGNLKEAHKVFDQLEKRNVVSWSTLIDGYAEQGLGYEAIICFREMECDGVAPDSVACACILKACAIVRTLEVVKEVHGHVKEHQLLKKDIVLGTALVNAYAKCGAVNEAHEIFDQLGESNVVSWSALIDGYAEQGFGEKALTCFKDMENHGHAPDSVAYGSSLKASALVGALQIVEQIHVKLREQGLLKKEIALGSALVNAYAKCGTVKEAREVFDQLAEKDVVSWSALIAGYAEHGFGEEALTCFRDMESDGVTPNPVTYASCLKACAVVGSLETVKEMHIEVRKQGLLEASIAVGNSLVNAYAKCGAVKEAQEVLDQLPQRDVVAWCALIAGYTEQGFGQEALACFRNMESDGVTPNSFTYACTLKACAIVGALETGKEIHIQVREQRLLENDVVLGNSVVNLYAKCGALKDAKETFDQLPDRDIVSWNSLLDGYAQFGGVHEMLQLSNRMMSEGVFPDPVTFLVLINGCTHGALFEEGQKLFHMIPKNDLSLTPKHHTCMVDLFGQAGCFDKAKHFVVDHTPAVLAFLGACRKWVNVDLARWAFEKLL